MPSCQSAGTMPDLQTWMNRDYKTRLTGSRAHFSSSTALDGYVNLMMMMMMSSSSGLVVVRTNEWRLAVVCAAATITSRTCAQSKMVPFRSGCFYYQMADGHNLRCFCNDRDFCNGAPRRPATTLLGVLSAAAFAATFRLLAIWQRRLYT